MILPFIIVGLFMFGLFAAMFVMALGGLREGIRQEKLRMLHFKYEYEAAKKKYNTLRKENARNEKNK